MIPWLTILFLFLALPASAGQAAASSTKPAPEAKPSPKDAELERAILDRFSRSKVAEDHFEVHVRGGIATLRGRTAVVQRKSAATRMAKTAGARVVVNQIQVSREGREKSSAPLRRRARIRQDGGAGRTGQQ